MMVKIAKVSNGLNLPLLFVSDGVGKIKYAFWYSKELGKDFTMPDAMETIKDLENKFPDNKFKIINNDLN